jgi:hypothetical protein
MKKNIKINYVGFLIIFIILFFISYREFLITLKLMLFHLYNYPMLPLDPYYKIILLFDGKEINLQDHQTINSSLSEGWPWWNQRIVPLWINWIVFKFVPCLKIKVIPEMINLETYCAIWSLSLVNYVSGLSIQLGFFALLKYKFKRPESECLLILFLSFFYINFLDRYGVDRISLLFLVIFFLLESKNKLKYFFIILSIFVNEKCTLLICTYYFVEYFNINKLTSSIFKREFILSFILCLIYFLISLNAVNYLIKSNITDYTYISFHGITNSIIPLILIILPFLFYFFKKNILRLFQLKQIYFLIFFVFLLLGIIIGGSGNMGRYLTYTTVIFLPLGNFLIYKIISNLDYFLLFPKYSKIEIIKILTKH